jgi:hypothetical protein
MIYHGNFCGIPGTTLYAMTWVVCRKAEVLVGHGTLTEMQLSTATGTVAMVTEETKSEATATAVAPDLPPSKWLAK